MKKTITATLSASIDDLPSANATGITLSLSFLCSSRRSHRYDFTLSWYTAGKGGNAVSGTLEAYKGTGRVKVYGSAGPTLRGRVLYLPTGEEVEGDKSVLSALLPFAL
jgi:hypothetical protein